MNKILMAVIAAIISSGAVKAADLENISAKDIVKMTREARTMIPEPEIAPMTKAAKPITAEVNFKSRPFAELLVNSLNVAPKLVVMAGGQSYVYKVGEGLTCYKSFATDIHVPNTPHKANYSCVISPAGGWKAMGMESYGAGDNRKFSLALYAALKVKETNDEGIKTKSIELERPDGDGGTERNLLSCINPSAQMEQMGFRPTCQLINGL